MDIFETIGGYADTAYEKGWLWWILGGLVVFYFLIKG
jgi:hypothetical protein